MGLPYGEPYASIILGREPIAGDRLMLYNLLDNLGTHRMPEDQWPDILILTTQPIGGSYAGEGLPFTVEWLFGEEFPGEFSDFPTWEKDLLRVFGIHPRARISLSAIFSGMQSHRVLGELSLYLARTFEGIIDFEQALMPLKSIGEAEKAHNWEEVAGPTRHMLQGMPGRVLELPYRAANRRPWVKHICDAEFMAAWLKHPDFHM